ncbi:ScbA/BarX family gamma-butyrolactone biosynthesis protein [Streptomyces sp. NPDC056796]|uniref:ScbA/BarX family gamma-butyrolactone biosynthesis protein n=1 Tax=Streptomyces sp. NPDC056796 TaxID=3345947 RepID=UPI003699AABB
MSTHLARKVYADQVLLTGWGSHGDGVSHTVLAAWPKHHSLYTSHRGVYHPLLLAETIRQALTVLSHTVHGIPLDHRLGWETFDTSIVTAALSTRPDHGTIRLTITHTEVERRRRGSARLAAQIMITRDDEPLGIARVRYIAHPPAIYDRLRGVHADARAAVARSLPLGPALDPSVRGDQTPLEHAVLTPLGEPHRWQLRVDVTNRIFFDHDHDHVPGFVLLEAAAQAAHAESGALETLPTAFDARFLRYVELDSPCLIESVPVRRKELGIITTLVTGRQNGQEVFSIRVSATERT